MLRRALCLKGAPRTARPPADLLEPAAWQPELSGAAPGADDQAVSVGVTAEASDNSEGGSTASPSESADTALTGVASCACCGNGLLPSRGHSLSRNVCACCTDTAASSAEQARQRGIPQLWRSLRQLHRPAALAARRGSPVKAAARGGSPSLLRGSPAKALPSESALSASPLAADLIAAGARTLLRIRRPALQAP